MLLLLLLLLSLLKKENIIIINERNSWILEADSFYLTEMKCF